MKIAVITGASSGLGREYALETAKSRDNIDEIWLIARREDKLKETAKDIKKIENNIDKLSMDKSMLHRGVNQGFSGGERKRNEINQ